ncbi:MAG: NAD(P)-dependent glycerol-3-phosphate dehydrogenase [Silicimonas sp.]|nr:NAD(P)-dependent glycerol-3-phosphate dehydrogenase [Silicimonas sp.]
MSISVLGSGAFGTALAMAFARDGTEVILLSRDEEDADKMQSARRSGQRLPGFDLPQSLTITSDSTAFETDVCLLAVPMQKLEAVLKEHPQLEGKSLVTCCKGIDLNTGLGPAETTTNQFPSANVAVLTGPSFAVDIARGLPTALVLAAHEESLAKDLQSILTRPALRLYRTTDVPGAELGGALKNVVALAAGIAIGAELGDSARASVIARGFAEMSRLALAKGARLETLQGLSGLGDLVLTCTSEKSRNFATGVGLGRGETIDPTTTVEGIATAQAVAATTDMELPILRAVAAVTLGALDIATAIETLLARPVGKE